MHPSYSLLKIEVVYLCLLHKPSRTKSHLVIQSNVFISQGLCPSGLIAIRPICQNIDSCNLYMPKRSWKFFNEKEKNYQFTGQHVSVMIIW